MKKILILASKRSDKKEEFITYLQNYFGKKAEVVLGIYTDLTFEMETGKVTVEIEGRNVKDFDLVYFRNTSGFHSLAAGLSVYLESAGISFFDNYLIGSSFAGDKFTSSMRLAVNGIPIVPSFVCSNELLPKVKKDIIKKYGFPVVAKEVRTQRMQGVYLLNTFKDFDKLPLTSKDGTPARYLFQKFIHFDKEFRVLVLGDAVGIIHTKTLRNNKGFKVGYADMNEYPEFLNPEDVSTVIKETAIKAAKDLHIQIAGVDICREVETGRIFVFEVNRGPGIDYNTSVSQEMPRIAEFFSNELDIKSS